MEAMFTFDGAGLWDGRDTYPVAVPVPRVPNKGEFVWLPDELGRWMVAEVAFDYSAGLGIGPVVRVSCEPEKT